MNIIKGDPILYKYSTPYKSEQNIFKNISRNRETGLRRLLLNNYRKFTSEIYV
jgi:hypothetical protein